jgi:hypothetical protein
MLYAPGGHGQLAVCVSSGYDIDQQQAHNALRNFPHPMSATTTGSAIWRSSVAQADTQPMWVWLEELRGLHVTAKLHTRANTLEISDNLAMPPGIRTDG